MNLKLEDFKEKGLYLLFPDGNFLALTPEVVEEKSRAILSDPAKIPPHVKKAEEFHLCSICPKNGSGDSCHAIRPILAFWENVDRYFSYDKVTAVYCGTGSFKVAAFEKPLQHALQYLSIMSLMQYCETGKKYWKYFYGVHPLMETEAVVTRVYLNMFWYCGGSLEKTREIITQFNEEITITTQCQMERIRLFCKHDPFLNALVITQLAAAFLALNAEEMVRQQLETFRQNDHL